MLKYRPIYHNRKVNIQTCVEFHHQIGLLAIMYVFNTKTLINAAQNVLLNQFITKKRPKLASLFLHKHRLLLTNETNILFNNKNIKVGMKNNGLVWDIPSG